MKSYIKELLESESYPVPADHSDIILLIPPELLKAYKEVDPSLPERLVKIQEEEVIHRRQQEVRIIKKVFLAARLDQVFALIGIVVISMLVYFYVKAGHPGEGSSIALGVMGTVASIFVIRRVPAKRKTGR